jgi:hypothetical protein
MAAAANADDKQLRVLEVAVRMREVMSTERANDIAEQHLDLNRRALETQRRGSPRHPPTWPTLDS